MRRHLDLMIEVFGEEHGCRMFRKIGPWYSKPSGRPMNSTNGSSAVKPRRVPGYSETLLRLAPASFWTRRAGSSPTINRRRWWRPSCANRTWPAARNPRAQGPGGSLVRIQQPTVTRGGTAHFELRSPGPGLHLVNQQVIIIIIFSTFCLL